MSWGRVTTDTEGLPLTAEIEYRIYSMVDGIDSDFKYRGNTKETFMVVPLQFQACFSVYVTAVRLDTNQESEPSNIESKCWYGNTPTDPEVPLEQFPPAGTTLEMTIDG